MFRNVVLGAAAGAAGTSALNVVTYGDMLLRGRPESSVPAEVAGELAHDAHIPLSKAGATDKAQHRQSGLGALMGYAVGLGLGALYGAFGRRLKWPVRLLVGSGIGLAAMVASDAPGIVLKKTNLRTWGVTSWIADLVPHLVYGLVTAQTFDSLMERRSSAKIQRQVRSLWRRTNRRAQVAKGAYRLVKAIF